MKNKDRNEEEIGIVKAATILKMHPQTLKTGIILGKLLIPYRKIPIMSNKGNKIYNSTGNRMLFKKSDLIKWVESTYQNKD